MNPTFMYVVASAMAIAALASAAFLIHTLIRLRPLIARLEGTARFLQTNEPRVNRILDDVGAELIELRGITEKAGRIVGDAEMVTRGLRVAARPIIAEVSDLGESIRHVRAAAVAVRAGMSAWRDSRRVNGAVLMSRDGHSEER